MAYKIPTAWSYSALSCYETCPRQFKFRYVEKRDEPKGPQMQRGITIHDQAAKFLAGETDVFPTSCAHFRDEFYELREFLPIVEQKWAFDERWRQTTWMAKTVKCRMVLDVGLVYSDNTAEVIDHKTGKRYDDDYRTQMGLFAAGMVKKFPYLTNVTARLWYLDENHEEIEEFTKAEALEILDDLTERADTMLNDRRWVPSPNFKCRFCHWRKDNGGPCEFS